MSRLTWGALSDRFYETGLDRGVLFIGDARGVPWNGLVSISESPTGGDARPAFLDGYKFRNISASEEFEGSLEAFSAPKAFGPCDGTLAIQNGLYATQQPRRSFSLAYRTQIGNPIDGVNFAYKIHLLYNVLAAPSERTNTTINETGEASTRSWSLTTRPPQVAGFKPTAHFVVDTREADPFDVQTLDYILYGSSLVDSRLPSVDELIGIFTAP